MRDIAIAQRQRVLKLAACSAPSKSDRNLQPTEMMSHQQRYTEMKTTLKAVAVLLAFVASFASANPAQHDHSERVTTTAAADGATKDLLMHHLQSFQKNDLEAVMSDYTDESVLTTKDATYSGRKEIRAFFASLIPEFPQNGSTFDLDKIVVNDGVVLIVWHAKTPTLDVPFATDTFVIKEGKISRQTFAGEVTHIVR